MNASGEDDEDSVFKISLSVWGIRLCVLGISLTVFDCGLENIYRMKKPTLFDTPAYRVNAAY